MQLDENKFVVNSLPSLIAFLAKVKALFEEFKFVTFEWRMGQDRSLDQNALFHVWLTDYCAHLGSLNKKQVTKGMIDFLKRKCKRAYYRETGAAWMLTRLVDPQTGEVGQVYYKSSKDYLVGEMFLFLTWLQNHAANDGCILESRGQYHKLQKEQQQ